AFLSSAFARQSRLPERAPAEPVSIANGEAALDVAGARDGHLHFYEVETPECPARFFVLEVGHELKTCADACEICGDKGYFESGGSIVCRNCTSPIARGTIGRGGCCNPVPVEHRLEGDRLTIPEAALRSIASHRKGR